MKKITRKKYEYIELINILHSLEPETLKIDEATKLIKDIGKFDNDKPIELPEKFIDIFLRNINKMVPTETVQRLQAEFENYKKYIEKRNGNLVKCASAELIKKLLPMLIQIIRLKNYREG